MLKILAGGPVSSRSGASGPVGLINNNTQNSCFAVTASITRHFSVSVNLTLNTHIMCHLNKCSHSLFFSRTMNSRSRRWCITLNNPCDNELVSIRNICGHPSCGYAIWQIEQGPSGTPHLQGYIRFENARRMGALKKIVGLSRAHLEIARGSEADSISYCSKEEGRLSEPECFGTPQPGQGSRTDVARYEEIRHLVHEGGLLAVAEADFGLFLRFHSGLSRYHNLALANHPRGCRTKLHIVLGHPGVGKTYWVSTQITSEETYWKEASDHWFCGYRPEQHSTVVIDEFLGGIPLSTLNRLCDLAPCSVRYKGGSMQFQARQVWILSNFRVSEWYQNARTPLDSLYRRIDNVTVFYEKWTPATTENTSEDRSEPQTEIIVACEAIF